MTAELTEREYREGNGIEIAFYDKGTCIGQAGVVGYKGKSNSFLFNLEVQEVCRGQGYGAAIVAYMIEKYDVRYLYVEKDNKVAIKLYKKIGFEEIFSFENFLEMERLLNDKT